MLREGDRRILSRPRATADDGWLVVVFSVPEAEREKRHALRSQLVRLGFGAAAPGVWVAPGTLYDEAVRALDRLSLTEFTEFFRGDYLGAGDVRARVESWWDLDEMAALYEQFFVTYFAVRRASAAESHRRTRSHLRADAHRLAAAAVPRSGPPARAPARKSGWAFGAASCSPTWTASLRKPAAEHAHAVLHA